jgi:hypothetical protein
MARGPSVRVIPCSTVFCGCRAGLGRIFALRIIRLYLDGTPGVLNESGRGW